MRNQLELQRQADQIAACAAKERAMNTCELKELILERSHHTDQLLRKLDEERVKQELTDAKQEILALRLGVGVSTTARTAV